MSKRAQLALGALTISMLSIAAGAQTSKAHTVTLMARVAPVARIAVDSAAANSTHFTAVPISMNEIEIVLDPPTANVDEISVPIVLSSNTKTYTLQASCDTADVGEIEVKNAAESGHEIFGRPRTLQPAVTFAMGTASGLSPSRALVQIRTRKDARERVKVRLRIQPLSI